MAVATSSMVKKLEKDTSERDIARRINPMWFFIISRFIAGIMLKICQNLTPAKNVGNTAILYTLAHRIKPSKPTLYGKKENNTGYHGWLGNRKGSFG